MRILPECSCRPPYTPFTRTLYVLFCSCGLRSVFTPRCAISDTEYLLGVFTTGVVFIRHGTGVHSIDTYSLCRLDVSVSFVMGLWIWNDM